MEQISCIIFDVDGTLTHTNELIFASFNHIAELYVGKTFSPGEITAMFGPPEDVAIARLVGKDRSKEAMESFCSFYDANHPGLAGAYDGIRDVLSFLKKQGLFLAVFTGKGRRTTDVTLGHLGLMQYFDIIVTGDDVHQHKPSAEGIRRILSELRVLPEEALMVGDSVSDVKAAREAGVGMAAVVWDSYAKNEVMGMGVEHLFHEVKDFAAWLQNLVVATKPVSN
jgi:HAD superfamily hydrolase (TIGR01509 family)